jgi:uncharacterized protein
MIHHIPGPAGRLEALIDDPAALCTTGQPVIAPPAPAPPPRAAVVVAHPLPVQGGTMHTKVVFQAAKAFCRLGCAVLRFNFRGVGASNGAFDQGRGEALDFRAAVDFMAARYPGVTIWAAGFSFGAWIAMETGATDDRVSVLIGIAPPVALYDFPAVRASTKPKFFIQGERDELCPLRALREFYAQIQEPKELAVIDAADHLFDGHVSEVGDAIEELLGDWGLGARDLGPG